MFCQQSVYLASSVALRRRKRVLSTSGESVWVLSGLSIRKRFCHRSRNASRFCQGLRDGGAFCQASQNRGSFVRRCRDARVLSGSSKRVWVLSCWPKRVEVLSGCLKGWSVLSGQPERARIGRLHRSKCAIAIGKHGDGRILFALRVPAVIAFCNKGQLPSSRFSLHNHGQSSLGIPLSSGSSRRDEGTQPSTSRNASPSSTPSISRSAVIIPTTAR